MPKNPWVWAAIAAALWYFFRKKTGGGAAAAASSSGGSIPPPTAMLLRNVHTGQVLDFNAPNAPAFVDTDTWKPAGPDPEGAIAAELAASAAQSGKPPAPAFGTESQVAG